MNTKTELHYFPSWVAGRAGYSERVQQMFREYLRVNGLLHTNQRVIILDHLLKADRHLTQDEIYDALKSRGIGKFTVFRTLKMLVSPRLADKVSGENGYARYEVNKDRPHHHHLVCMKCGAIREIRLPEVERTQKKACRKAGFTLLTRRNELMGLCRNCGLTRQ